jgi:rhodanese-related sulfurtransferase
MDKLPTFITHHWLLCVLFVVLLAAVILYEKNTQRQTSSANLSPEQAVNLMNRESAVVIDVRRKDAFVRGHIVGAINVPFAELGKDIKKLKKHKGKPIIIVCNQGTDSVKALKLIDDNEFKQVTLIKGGYTAWRDAKLPLEK